MVGKRGRNSNRHPDPACLVLQSTFTKIFSLELKIMIHTRPALSLKFCALLVLSILVCSLGACTSTSVIPIAPASAPVSTLTSIPITPLQDANSPSMTVAATHTTTPTSSPMPLVDLAG